MSEHYATHLSGGNTNGTRNPTDFYPTPPEATQSLLDFLKLTEDVRIWEPAAGEGDMVIVMRNNGYNVIATDVTNDIDFLACELPQEGFDWIITNPPFSRSEEFIKRCVEIGKPFALLLKTQYWHAKRRSELFRNHPPSYVLPLTWRPDFLFKTRKNGERGNSLFEVSWNVWIPPFNGYFSTIYRPLDKPE